VVDRTALLLLLLLLLACCSAGPDASKQLEIAGVTFVAKDGRAGWRNAWRKRRSATGVPAQQLDFNLWFIRQEQQQDQQEQEQQQQQA
jgi:ABC-type sugar transport system substrate-binding protein